MPIHRIESGVAPMRGRLKVVGGVETGNTVPGGHSDYILTPPTGKIWKVITVYLQVDAPPLAASGTHMFKVLLQNAAIISGQSNYGADLRFDTSVWETADSLQRPSTEIAAITALKGMIVNTENVITVYYKNATNVVSTGSRYMFFHIIELPEI